MPLAVRLSLVESIHRYKMKKRVSNRVGLDSRDGGRREDATRAAMVQAGDAGDGAAPNEAAVLPRWIFVTVVTISIGLMIAVAVGTFDQASLQSSREAATSTATERADESDRGSTAQSVADVWSLKHATHSGASVKLEAFLLADDLDDLLRCAGMLRSGYDPQELGGVAMGDGIVADELLREAVAVAHSLSESRDGPDTDVQGASLSPATQQAVGNILSEGWPSPVAALSRTVLLESQLAVLSSAMAERYPALATMAVVGLERGRSHATADEQRQLKQRVIDLVVGGRVHIAGERAAGALFHSTTEEGTWMSTSDEGDTAVAAGLTAHPLSSVRYAARSWLLSAVDDVTQLTATLASAGLLVDQVDEVVREFEEDRAGAVEQPAQPEGGQEGLRDISQGTRPPQFSYVPNIAEVTILSKLHRDIVAEESGDGGPSSGMSVGPALWDKFGRFIGAIAEDGTSHLPFTFRDADVNGDSSVSVAEWVLCWKGRLIPPGAYSTPRCGGVR